MASTAMRDILAVMSDTNLRRLRRMIEAELLGRPDDRQAALLHELVVAEERRRRDAGGRAA